MPLLPSIDILLLRFLINSYDKKRNEIVAGGSGG